MAEGAAPHPPASSAAGRTSPLLPGVDLAAFASEVRALRAELLAGLGADDLAHLRRMERWGRACTLAGYGTAWIAPNPLSAIAMALGNSARWTMIAHHVMHRGYDRVPGTPARLTSRRFARGWRRLLDWPDWMCPAAWDHEHNQLHHFNTGEPGDPDLVERNARLLRRLPLPGVLKGLLIILLMATWKLAYYAPSTYWAWCEQRERSARRRGSAAPPSASERANRTVLLFPGERLLLPLSRRALAFWLRSPLPYAAWRFGLLPALFLPLGTWAWAAVLLNSLFAELLSNLHTFLIIVPNHAGDDVHRYDDHFSDRDDFVVRQVLGSVNYTGGSDLRDFLQGYLNYQIEHHVWPDLPMLAYRRAAPRLKAICARHGVPYIEDGVLRRFGKLWAIMTGAADMRRAPTMARGPMPVAETAGTLGVNASG